MRLYYYQDPVGNFGDDLNPWLWSRLLPDLIDIENPVPAFRSSDLSASEGPIFIGIGTLLDAKNIPQAPKKIIFGAGVGHYSTPPQMDETFEVYCVRGPLTAKALQLGPDSAAADPGILLRAVDLPAPASKKYALSFMPHHGSIKKFDWSTVCSWHGIHYINPTHSVDTVLAEIQKSEVLISEALHGAVAADALRVPWIPARFHAHIDTMKWDDWCQSMQLSYTPLSPFRYLSRGASPSWSEHAKNLLKWGHIHWLLRAPMTHCEPQMSADGVLDTMVAKLWNDLRRLAQAFDAELQWPSTQRAVPNP